MAIVKDTSLRVLGDVVRAGRTTAKRMGYVVDTGKYGKVKVVEVECAGRKVRALVGTLDVEPERYDALTEQEKQTARERFAAAGIADATVARLVEAL